MPRFHLAGLFVCFLLLTGAVPIAAQDEPSCADFNAYEWAQAVFDSDPEEYDALDPDGDGRICPKLPKGGFAPAFWLDEMPGDLEEAQIIRVIDGDTFEVTIEGVSNRVRIYRADTPETQNEQHCGGEQATEFAEYALSFNDGDSVYLERDANERDRYGRELAYVWFEVDGMPYMLNHILINSGWAEDVDYGDRKYDDELKDAAAFAERHDLGAWELCDGFRVPLEDVPEAVPAVEEPQQHPPTQPEAPVTGNCDPNYTPCIPAYPPDLDCGQIGFAVQVIGSDPHGLDRDNDGSGCE